MAAKVFESMRKEKYALLTLSLCILLIWLPRLRGPLDLRWDGGVYYILGTALAEGKGYRLLNEPGEIRANQYPPLLPAIIAVHQLILGTSDPTTVGRWLRLTWFIIFAAYIFAIYFFLRRYLQDKYALIGALICLFNLHTYFLSDLCFPEILFGLTTVLFFLSQGGKRRNSALGFSYLWAIFSYALRTIGIAVFAAWIMESLLKRKFKKSLLLVILSLIPIICWQGYVKSVEADVSYQHPAYQYQRADYMFYNVSYARNISLKDPFIPERGYLTGATFARRFMHNVLRMPASMGEAVSIREYYWETSLKFLTKDKLGSQIISWIVYAALIVIGCLVCFGLILRLLKRELIIPLYIMIYLVGICLTPFPEQFNRYLAPLAPFLVLCLLEALLSLQAFSIKAFPARLKNAGLIFTASVITLIYLQQLSGAIHVHAEEHLPVSYTDPRGRLINTHMFFYNKSYKAFDEGLDWLKDRAKPGDLVAASMPHWVYLRTGLKSVMPPFETDPKRVQTLLDTVPINYLILHQGAPDLSDFTKSIISQNPDRWQLVYSSADGRLAIYQRTRI